MNKMKRKSKPGFTLIELTVVVTIIIMLIAIITPTVKKALLLGKRADAAAYLSSISSACLQYKNDTGLFPGQDRTDEIGDDPSADEVTGSQMLAMCLLDGLIINSSGDNVEKETSATTVEGNYLDEYKAGKTTATLKTRNYTLTDMWKGDSDDTRALVYYPSRIGNDGTISGSDAAFVYDDNSAYLSETDPETSTKFGEVITDNRFGGTTPKAYNADTFILISPGIDRIYFNEDDLMNFSK